MFTLPITLSPLQQAGVERLLESRASILADPPGAGKTWTTIATLMNDSYGVKRVLVVAPNQVLQQWHDEIVRVAEKNLCKDQKTSKIKTFYPRSYKDFRHMMFKTEPEQSMFLFLTPSLMLRLVKVLQKFALTHAVLDEVHLYSRPKTKGWAALKSFLSKVKQRVILLSANPIQNSYKELEGLYRLFSDDKDVTPIPIIRRKADSSYLPEREDIVRELKMDQDESKAYFDMMAEHANTLPIVQMIKQSIFGLRSIHSQKTKAVVADCLRLKKEGKRTLIVLHRKLHFKVLTEALRSAGLTVDEWSGSVKQNDRSQKLKDWQWFRDHDVNAKDLLRKTKLGACAIPNFADMISEYWKVPDVLLLQSRAGGVGLNLQMFQAVLLPSLDWNPCSEDQAVARVIRRGQKAESVPVIRYIQKHTIDERIMTRQQEKRQIAYTYMN